MPTESFSILEHRDFRQASNFRLLERSGPQFLMASKHASLEIDSHAFILFAKIQTDPNVYSGAEDTQGVMTSEDDCGIYTGMSGSGG